MHITSFNTGYNSYNSYNNYNTSQNKNCCGPKGQSFKAISNDAQKLINVINNPSLPLNRKSKAVRDLMTFTRKEWAGFRRQDHSDLKVAIELAIKRPGQNDSVKNVLGNFVKDFWG